EPGAQIRVAPEIVTRGSQVPTKRFRQICPRVILDSQFLRPLACRVDPRILSFNMPRAIKKPVTEDDIRRKCVHFVEVEDESAKYKARLTDPWAHGWSDGVVGWEPVI